MPRKRLALPSLTIGTFGMSSGQCATCGRACTHERENLTPFPGAYAADTINDTAFPSPICDHCVHAHYPASVADLAAERERFWSG